MRNLHRQRLPSLFSQLRRLSRKWAKKRSRRALYGYLNLTFETYALSKDYDLDIHRYLVGCSGKTGRRRHTIRQLIEATASADRKTKSRWTQALRYAWRERRRYKLASGCFQDNSGIAGCAKKWALCKAEMKTPLGYVRMGGENRVPKIPYCVGVEFFDEFGNYRGPKSG